MMWIADWRRVLPTALFACALPLAALPLAAQDQPQPAPQPADPADADAAAAAAALAKAKDLIGKMQSDDYQTREDAQATLEKMGRAAVPALKQALQSTTDPDLSWRLEGLIEKAAKAAPEPQQRPQRQPFQANPGGGGAIMPGGMSMTVIDGTGSYSKSSLPNGGIRASRTPRGGETETREFKSEEEFKAEWPDVAKRFGGITLRLSPRVLPADPQDPQDEPRSQDENGPQRVMPFPGPFGPNGGQADEATEELQRRLQEMLQQMMNGQGMQLPDPSDLVPDEFEKMLEDMQRQADEMQRQLEELGRDADEALRNRLRELRDRRPDPGTEPDAFRRWAEEWRRLNDGMGMGQSQERDPQSQERNAPNGQSTPNGPNGPNGPTATVAGVSFGPIDPAIRAQLQLGEREGLLVTGLHDDGLLVTAGLQRFDVLLTVNQRPVFSADDVAAALAAVPEGSQYVVTVIRKKERLQLLGNK